MKNIFLGKSAYISFFLICLIFAVNNSVFKIILFAGSLFFLSLPGVKRLKKDQIILIVQAAIITLLLLVVTGLIFRKIRALFGTPMIGDSKLVGFAQYFGYPLFYDTLLFLFIVAVPVLVIFALFLKGKSK